VPCPSPRGGSAIGGGLEEREFTPRLAAIHCVSCTLSTSLISFFHLKNNIFILDVLYLEKLTFKATLLHQDFTLMKGWR
jgi:hypothetical protein